MVNKIVDFVKFNPTQNMTILVTTSYEDDLERLQTAKELMAYGHLHAEQVGFIEKPRIISASAALRMAGGEFCGNACMALAAWLWSGNNDDRPNEGELMLEVSGTDRLVACRVRREGENYRCRVEMPVPVGFEAFHVSYGGRIWHMVKLNYSDAIHIIMEIQSFNEAIRSQAEELARLLGKTTGQSLVGIMLYQADVRQMAPLIYVRTLDSLVWERGCGSGTASIGAYLAWKLRSHVSVQVKQPGGIIEAEASYTDGEVTSVRIEGSVGIVAQGKAYIHVGETAEKEEVGIAWQR